MARLVRNLLFALSVALVIPHTVPIKALAQDKPAKDPKGTKYAMPSPDHFNGDLSNGIKLGDSYDAFQKQLEQLHLKQKI